MNEWMNERMNEQHCLQTKEVFSRMRPKTEWDEMMTTYDPVGPWTENSEQIDAENGGYWNPVERN